MFIMPSECVQHESSGATVHTRRRRSNVRNRLTFKLTSKFVHC